MRATAAGTEAQQSYFRAYTAEPDNPDILYNLAISLEHMRQNKLAAQYYSQAIAAAQNRPAGFDKAQAAARLAKPCSPNRVLASAMQRA
jgi:tetratricopeptide (TPR) repeat protein